MASFDEHILQAKRNLEFLAQINLNNISHWDWQVTTCFYVAVHIINAHLAKVSNSHYRTHVDVKNAIFEGNASANSRAIVPNNIYLAYTKLEGLSRRARYLCHDHPSVSDTNQHLTYEKELGKAIRHLDTFLHYFKKKYSLDFGTLLIACSEISRSSHLEVFTLK